MKGDASLKNVADIVDFAKNTVWLEGGGEMMGFLDVLLPSVFVPKGK